jgi:hypothetical protein
MSCNGAYAEAWEFASWFCKGALLERVDDSGGAGNAALADSQVDFLRLGVQANVGMVLYNVTQGTNGPVTAVTTHSVTATGVTWDDGDEYRIVTLDAQQIAAIERNLSIAATDIHAALAASGACDCTLSSWGSQFLAKINIIDAAAFYSCTCGQPAAAALSDETRRRYQEWVQTQLNLIRTMKLELCDGETGADFPVTGWAQQGLTEFNKAQIIVDDIVKNSS